MTRTKTRRFRGWGEQEGRWNLGCDGLGALMIVLFVLSLPSSSMWVPLVGTVTVPLDWFTPSTTLVFPFNGTLVHHHADGSPDTTYTVYSFITLSGKGGISVGTPVTINVTLGIPKQLVGLTGTEIKPLNGLRYPLAYNNTVLKPLFGGFNLTKSGAWGDTVRWAGSNKVWYSEAGTWGVNMTYFTQFGKVGASGTPATVQIGSADITPQSFANTLTVSLTFVVLSLSAFSLRSKKASN